MSWFSESHPTEAHRPGLPLWPLALTLRTVLFLHLPIMKMLSPFPSQPNSETPNPTSWSGLLGFEVGSAHTPGLLSGTFQAGGAWLGGGAQGLCHFLTSLL